MKALPDVGAALGGVQGDAHLIGKNGKAIVFGGAPNIGFSVDPTQPRFNSLSLYKGAWPKAGEVIIDKSTAGKKHLEVGQMIGVQSRGPVVQLRISGFAKYGAVSSIGGATLAGFDLKTAQSLFGKDGKLDQIRIAKKPGVTAQQLLAEVRSVLPPGTQVRSGDAQASKDAEDTNSFLSFLQKFLLAFGGVALFVGSFVIANSLSITIAQRTREFATLRTLGASRRQVLRSVLVEALVMGVLASVTGLFLGLALAKGLFWLFEEGRLHPAQQRPAVPHAHDPRLAPGRDRRDGAREPETCVPGDARAPHRRGAGRRRAATRPLRPLPPGRVGPHRGDRLRGLALRPLRRARHDQRDRVHARRGAR